MKLILNFLDSLENKRNKQYKDLMEIYKSYNTIYTACLTEHKQGPVSSSVK